MKNFFLLLLMLLGLQVKLFAQAPSITITYPEPVCLNSVQKVQVAIAGSFNSNNKFTVQVRISDNTPVLSEIPAELIEGKIHVMYSDSSLSVPPYIQIRILSTSPKVESNWYNTKIHTKGIVQLSTFQPDSINAGEDLLLKFRTFSSSSAQIVLNDGSSYGLDSFLSGYVDHMRRKATNVSTPFTIARAENICGVMKSGGEAKAYINPTSLKVISVHPETTCEGSEIKVSYSTFGQALPTSAKYKLRITVYTGDSKTVEVPAVLKDNLLTATFPTSFNVSSRGEYKLRIIADNPAIVGLESDYSFYVHPKAGASVNTTSKTINIGEKVQVGVSFSGIPPFSATLQDGTEIAANFNYQTEVRPAKTTSYSVKSFSSGCGMIPVTAPSSAMLVTVRPGIYMDPTEETKNLCEGTLVKVKVLSNVDFNANATFKVNALVGNTTAYSFPATKVGDYLEFRIPALPENIDRTLSYDKVNGLSISTTNPEYTSERYDGYVLRSKPGATVLPHSELIYKTPSLAMFGYTLHGKGPFTIVDEFDKTHYIEGAEAWYPEFYVEKTSDFKLKSISNACSRNETLPTIRLSLDTTGSATGIHLKPLNSSVCAQDSVEITFLTTGKFQHDNTFRIEGYTNCCNFQTFATVNKPGTYKIKIPVSQAGTASLRIASSNPAMLSKTIQTELHSTLENFSIRPFGTPSEPAELLGSGQFPLTVTNERNDRLYSFTYSDGVTEKTLDFPRYDRTVYLPNPPAGSTTAFTIKSATNKCGTFPVNITTYLRTVPYRITVGGISPRDLDACQNGHLSIPFVTTGGDAAKASFSLQIAKDKSTEFTDLAKNITARQFDVKIPTDFATGLYQIRVTSSEGGVSNLVNLRIGSSPSAVLTTTEKDPIVLNSGSGIASATTFTGTPYWTVIYENGYKQVTSENPYTRILSAQNAKEFSIISVYNNCGYGPVSGKIAVKVNPDLNIYTDAQEVCEGESVDVRYDLRGDATLTNDYIRFQLEDTQSGKVINLDSTRIKSGSITLKLPAILTGNFYDFRATVQSYSLTATAKLTIKSKVDVTLSGNTTINAGDATQIQIQSNKQANEPIQYRLSDGTAGTFYGGSGNRETDIRVTPSVTTIYSIVSANNGCGEGKKSGAAIVEVNPSGSKSVTTTGWDAYEGSAFCLGDAFLVTYTQKGSFSSGNTMTVQISDTTGRNFKSVTTIGNSSPLRATVPADLFIGKKYRIRVVASDAGTASGAYEFPLSAGRKATIRFASESVISDASNIQKAVVLLDGTGPWDYTYGSDLHSNMEYSRTPVDTIYFPQNSTAEYYKLFSVSNQCGPGVIGTPNTIRLSVITGEAGYTPSQILVAPNPTQDQLIIKFPDPTIRTITLINSTGVVVLREEIAVKEKQISVHHLPSGIYILNIEGKNLKSVHKILKQ
jgi:hypothetical protein